MEMAEFCPFAQQDADECSAADAGTSDEHMQWHLDYEVRMGRMLKNDDGTYSLPDGPMEPLMVFSSGETYTMTQMQEYFGIWRDHPDRVPDVVRAVFEDERITPMPEELQQYE